METTIDKAGRVVVPKELRDSLGLSGGEALEIREIDGRIELEPLPTAVRLEDRAAGLVAVAEEELPPLSDDIVRATLERSRR
jgi:AbrB family looped-hinge helix DNA binding protein